MGILKQVFIYTILFVLSTFLAFQSEHKFRSLIRSIYTVASNEHVRFYQPGKYFHFVSATFLLSFGIFVMIYYYLMTDLSIPQRLNAIGLSIFIFIVSAISYCYFDGLIKVLECASCANGNRTLRYNDINYDFLFINGLIASTIPSAASKIKKVLAAK
jgi:hypothetical protein